MVTRKVIKHGFKKEIVDGNVCYIPIKDGKRPVSDSVRFDTSKEAAQVASDSVARECMRDSNLLCRITGEYVGEVT